MIKSRSQESEALSVRRKCDLLGISRSSYYYEHVEIGDKYSDLIWEIDRIHLEMPFFGQRGIRDTLQLGGTRVGRDLLRTLMRHMRIEAIFQGPKTSVPGKGKAHKTYPYLLKDLDICKANQVWTTDISYVPMGKGFMYLTAIMDWHTRKILSWRLSNSMTVDFCLECLNEAIANFGKPDIINTDQGSQYTGERFRNEVIEKNGITLSMDGKGRWADNIMIERFWRDIKYNEIYLRAYEDGKEARKGIGNYILLHNSKRPHSSLKQNGKAQTPDDVFFSQFPHLRNQVKGA